MMNALCRNRTWGRGADTIGAADGEGVGPALLPAGPKGFAAAALGVALAPPDAAGVVPRVALEGAVEGAAEAAAEAAVVGATGAVEAAAAGAVEAAGVGAAALVGTGGGVAVLLAPQAASRAVAAPAVASSDAPA